MIECLKDTGMPLKGIKQYIDWFIEGNSTLPQRLEMFKTKNQNRRTNRPFQQTPAKNKL